MKLIYDWNFKELIILFGRLDCKKSIYLKLW